MNDEFAGQGGSYVMDPITGKRTLVERTDAPQTKPQPVAPAAPTERKPKAADKE